MKRIMLVCVALALITACGRVDHQTNHTTPSPAPSGPAAAGVTSKGYTGEGTVKAIDPNARTIEIDHGDIEGLMPAMQMEFNVTDAAMLNGIAVNDRIDFTVEDHAGTMRVTAIKKK